MIFTAVNSITEPNSSAPNPRIDIDDNRNKPRIFASDDKTTNFILAVTPFVIAKKTAGPGLTM